MRWLLAVMLLPATLSLGQVIDGPVGSGPEPTPLPTAWELEFRYRNLQRIDILTGNQRQSYWYMIYTVTNPSPNTLRFYPQLELVTERLNVVPSDVGIPPAVYQAIQEQHRLTHRYFVHPTKASGPIRTGRDNAIDSVAVWHESALQTTAFTIYVSGLSGEARLVRNPAYDPDAPEKINVPGPFGRDQEMTVNPRAFTLRKTLALSYRLAGSGNARPWTDPDPIRVEWIMR